MGSLVRHDAVVIPIFAASANLRSDCDTGLISPQADFAEEDGARSNRAIVDARANAVATARSPAGSCSRTPPTTSETHRAA